MFSYMQAWRNGLNVLFGNMERARRHRNKGLETKTGAGLLTIVFTQI